MLKRLLFITAIVTSFCASAEKCQVTYLETLDYTDIECQFYLGTTAYRHQLYGVAAAHWEYILAAPLKYDGDDELQATALSTLAFLNYQGLGMQKDIELAVTRWQGAAKKGAIEARKHLGAVYKNSQYAQFDLVKSLAWYESVVVLLEKEAALSKTQTEILNDAMTDAEMVRKQLTKQQIETAEIYRKSILAL